MTDWTDPPAAQAWPDPPAEQAALPQDAPNTALQDHFDSQIKAAVAANVGPDGEKKPFTFEDAVKAGWQNSIIGLSLERKAPDRILPEDAPWYQRIAAQATNLAADAPYMAEGAVIGQLSGAPGGAAGGALALPAAMRKIMMDHFKDGSISTPQEFLSRASGALIEASKGYLTGGATAGVGGLAESMGAGAMVSTGAQLATMVNISKGLEGHLAGWKDYLDGGLLLFGMKTAELGAHKLADIYTKTGVQPAQVVQDAAKLPVLKAELLSNAEIPPTYGHLIDPSFKQAAAAPAEPPAPEPATTPEGQAAERILSKIQVGGEGAPKKAYTFAKFYADWVDNLDPVKRIVKGLTGGEELPASEDPYKLFRVTRGGYERANQFITDATVGFKDYKPNGDSLMKVLEPVKDDLDGLRTYVAAKRALELESRGIQSGFDPADAKTVVDTHAAKYEGVATGLTGYLNRVTGYARDTGLIDKKTYETFTAMNKNYVPFNRVMPDTEDIGSGTPGGMQTRNPVKTIKGSAKDIIDPIETTIRNTYSLLTLAERNNASLKLIKLADKYEQIGPGKVFEKITAPVRGITVGDKELKAFLAEHGIEDVPDEALTIFRAQRQPLADNEFAVFNKGEKQVYATDNAELVTALKGSPSQMNDPIFKFVSSFTRYFRAGTILNPDFLPRHIVRQNINAFMNSPTGLLPVWSALKGAADMIGDKNSELLQQWRSGGGMNSEITAWDRRYIQNSINKVEGGESLMGWIERTKDDPMSLTKLPYNGVQSALDMVHSVIAGHDNFLRFAQFKAMMGDLASQGVTGKDAIIESAYQSREVLLDNFRRGARMQAINQIWAFSNLRVQGIDKLARLFQEAPERTAMRVGAGIAVPTMLLWWANHDDPRYKETQDWQRDNFWPIFTDDWRAPKPGDVLPEMDGMSREGKNGMEYNFGQTFRISKPQESGLLFGSSLERFLDFAHSKDPQTAVALAKSFKDALVPEVIPSMLTPVYEAWANKSLFTGGPLVPANAEKLLPAYQQTNYTTELAKALGQIVGTVPGMSDSPMSSPPIIENYVRQWTGGLGMYALQLADKSLRAAGVLPDPTKPDTTLADIPFIRAFVMRFPTASTKSITDFYDQYDHASKAYATIQSLAKRGNIEASMSLARTDPSAQVKLDGIRQALTNQQNFIQMTYDNPEYTSSEKRQLIDSAYYQMISTAQLGNTIMEGLAASLKGNKN